MQIVGLLKWIAQVNKESTFAVMVCCSPAQLPLFNDQLKSDVPGLSAIDQIVLRKHGKNHQVMANNTRLKDIENGVGCCLCGWLVFLVVGWVIHAKSHARCLCCCAGYFAIW